MAQLLRSRRNEGDPMAKKSGLTKVAVKIGTVVGKADKTAHKFAKAGSLAKKELDDISKQVDALKKQLSKTTKKLRLALR
jgi:hypothetical protein